MGQLKPGTQYIYEKANGITYAREVGAPFHTRFEIGRDYDRRWRDEINLWEDIVKCSKENFQLKEALERVKVIYYLSKQNGSKA